MGKCASLEGEPRGRTALQGTDSLFVCHSEKKMGGREQNLKTEPFLCSFKVHAPLKTAGLLIQHLYLHDPQTVKTRCK